MFVSRVGGYVGAGSVHPALVDAVRETAAAARAAARLHDSYVGRCGDALALVVTHDAPVADVAAEAFGSAGAAACRLGQHRAFDPTSNGGPHVEETTIVFEPRTSEPVLVFVCSGAPSWNLVLYRAFADPLNTPGLLGPLAAGFRFTAADGEVFDLPEDAYRLLGRPGAIERIVSRGTGAPAASAGAAALVVRCEDGFPSVGEVLEPFAHTRSLMPVSANDDPSTRAGAPPRVVGLGFQLAGGRLVGPRDLLGDRAFEPARAAALDQPAAAPLPAAVREPGVVLAD